MALIIDDKNWQQLVGPTHDEIDQATGRRYPVRVEGGQKRYLSRFETTSGRKFMAMSPRFSDTFPVFDRASWPERIKDQLRKKTRISDFQRFAPHDQDGLPTCWANGPAHAGTTRRVIDGGLKKLVYLSACSAAVPISGGHSGGDEADAGELFQKRGAASVDVWPNNDTSRSLDSDQKVSESRKHHFFYQLYQLRTFAEFMTACLMDPPKPIAVAFNWWSHVISGGDPIMFGADAFGIMYRNNWGDWGDKNDNGFYGYITMHEGHGTPDSGFCIGPITASLA
jgi:hypothetical protein